MPAPRKCSYCNCELHPNEYEDWETICDECLNNEDEEDFNEDEDE